MPNNAPTPSYAAVFRRLVTARAPRFALLRRLLVVLGCVAGAVSLGFSAQSLRPPYVFMKDFIQEYLLARAMLAGVPPYLPLPDLAERFLGPLPNPIFPHPTPHPPPVGLMALPLGVLGYQQAAIAWYVFEVICVTAAVYLLLDWLGAATRVRVAIVTLALFAWNPFWEELLFVS